MRENAIRGAFSLVAGAVFTATSAEWFLWAYEQRRPWKYLVSAFLTGMSLFEAHIVWRRVDRILAEI